MDWIGEVGLIVNGLIVLFAFYQLKEIRKEISLLGKQVVFQRLQFYPILEIQRFEVDENSLMIDLKNEGNGISTRLAVKTRIVPFEIEKSVHNFIDELQEIEEQTRKSKKIIPMDGVLFLKNRKGRFRLYPGMSDTFSAELMVGFRRSETSWKFYTFNELRELFKHNKVRYGGFLCQLAYQDLSENILELENIKNVVIDFHRHSNFGEAIGDNKVFTPVTVGLEEIQMLDWDSYVRLKSQRSLAA